MKPRVANRNMPAAMYWRPPVLVPAIVATSTIEPRLPSIGIAFIRTPLAPSACSMRGGGCSSSRPTGSSGSSRRPPRRVVGVVGDVDVAVCVTASDVVVTLRLLPPEPAVRLNDKRVPEEDYRAPTTSRLISGGEASVAGPRRTAVAGSTLALTVHGQAGVVDLLVPVGASADDVAREYAAQCRLTFVPALHTRTGRALDPAESLTDVGLTSGTVLIAASSVRPSGDPRSDTGRSRRRWSATTPGAFSLLWCTVAVVVAALAAWFAAHTDGTEHDLTVLLLAGSAVLGVLPLGGYAPHRAVAAPAFGAAAAFATIWGPESERLPTIVGVSALVAAVTAAVARALDRRAEELLRVWVVAGVALFVLTGAGALVGARPEVVWGVLLVLAMLAARFVPALAVDVPDQYLIDIERLAVSAWSARDRPRGRRGRTVVPPGDVAVVATRASRTVTAAAGAIWVVAVISAPMLLATATLPVDRVGARVVVGLVGGALLLTGRSYRHRGARAMLRAAGLSCWVALLAVLLDLLSDERRFTLAVAVIVLATLLVVVAVANGRGWRSAWWSRRAEVAEGLAGAGAIAALVVSSGLFRTLWEIKFRV